MTAEQQQALGELAVWVATAQELTTKAQESAYRIDMLPHTPHVETVALLRRGR